MKKYGLLEVEEMERIIADSNVQSMDSELASSASAGAAAAGCAIAAAFAA